jgi:hypothetical protein
MKIAKQKLVKIIREEVRKKKSEIEKMRDNTKRKQAQRKRDELRYGDESIRKLSVGITEDNYWRDENGFFTSAKDAATYSSYFVDGERKNLKGPTKSVKDSGRGETKKGSGKFRLKNGTAKYEDRSYGPEEEVFKFTRRELEELVGKACNQFFHSYLDHNGREFVIGEDGSIDWGKECRKRRYQTFADYLNAIDKVNRAEDGKLHTQGNRV